MIITFLVASSDKCIEIQSSDIQSALKQGMIDLQQDEKFGNVVGCIKPDNKEGLRQLYQRLIVSNYDYFEYYGNHNHESVCLEKYINNLI